MTTGWIIAVLLEPEGEPRPVRHYFAVAQSDQARAEWAAADAALVTDHVAPSPSGGMEPIEALSQLSASSVRSLGLRPGQVKPLGAKWPRRWITPVPASDLSL